MIEKGRRLSLISSSGKPDPSLEEPDAVIPSEDEQRPFPLKWILLSLVILGGACIIGFQIIGVLYVIVFPPTPPVPDGAVEVSHVNTDYGVDQWVYLTTEPACDVLRFYLNEGVQCRLAPNCDVAPATGAAPNTENTSQVVARCAAEEQASIFAMRWQLIIAISPSLRTEFRLEREVFWTGAAPPLQQPELP
jgi:hypothetical protein